jgi:hypothetical protein
MMLARAAGIAKLPDNLSDDAKAALIDAATAFLRAGGSIRLSDWADLDAAERAAFEEASIIAEVAKAARLAVALSGPDGLARVLAEVDGGDASAQLACEAAVERILSRPREVVRE